jgi:SWI/SNF-related matrix-associated actin-dependent regulator 1 of chromatin subfamily A
MAWAVMDDKALARLEAATAWSREVTPATGKTVPTPTGVRAFPHQVAAAHELAQRGRLMLCDTMGLGKTGSAIMAANLLDWTLSRILVLCPASLRLNWLKEIKIFSTMGLRAGLWEEMGGGPGWSVLNYDRLQGQRDALLAVDWDLVICDEAHRLKNPKAKRTKEALGSAEDPGLVRKAKRAFLLTGTPLINQLEEIYAPLSALQPDVWTRGMFERDHLGYFGKRPPKRKAQATPALEYRLRLQTMLRRMEAPGVSIPTKATRYTPCYTKRKADETLTRDMDEILRSTAKTHLEAVLGGTRACDLSAPPLRVAFDKNLGSFSAARAAAAMDKVDVAMERLEEIMEERQKVVVFAHHRDVVSAVAKGCGERGWGVRVINGGVSQRARQEAVDAFQAEGDDVRVIVCGLEAASEGLTLTRAAYILRIETDWRPAINEQAEARCVRIGQRERVVTVEVLVAQDGIDGRLLRANARKAAMSRIALDGSLEYAARSAEEREEVIGRLSRIDGAYEQALAKLLEEVQDKWTPEVSRLAWGAIEGARETA